MRVGLRIAIQRVVARGVRAGFSIPRATARALEGADVTGHLVHSMLRDGDRSQRGPMDREARAPPE